MAGCLSVSPSRQSWRLWWLARQRCFNIVSNQLLFFGLIVAELGLVFYLSARVETLAPTTAMTLFIVYSALNGVTLSFILLVYTGESIASTFLVTSGMFGALALFGSTTKRSLAGVGQFLFMGLIGLVLASIVGMFWHNDTLQFLISTIGVIVFTGLTAWDAQRLKQMAATVPEDRMGSYAVVGASPSTSISSTSFLMLLRLLGGRRINPDGWRTPLVDMAPSSLMLCRGFGDLDCIPVKHSRHREDHCSQAATGDAQMKGLSVKRMLSWG